VIGVLVSGEGSNLQALIDDGLPVAAVASNRAGARALERAAAAAIPARAFELAAHESRAARDAAMASWLGEHGVDLVVCAGYMHLLTPAFLDRFPQRIVNVHPSLLPAFPGARALEDALAAGVAVTGVTVHRVDEGLDTGAVLEQQPVAVEPRATLEQRIHAAEHALLPKVVRELVAASGSPLPVPGRRGQYGNTNPESAAPGAARVVRGAGLRAAGAGDGRWWRCAR
jgi:phosphoribosylglycinamide formyltransferase 1